MPRRHARDDGDMREIVIATGVIRLGQFLKLADVVELGSDVKSVLAEGGVRVNGVPEVRRGRQLGRGDVVSVGDIDLRVA
jgi:ribosome-associated protein